MTVRAIERGFIFTVKTRRVPSISSVLYVSGCVLFVVALFFGGGTKQGLWSDSIIEIAALPVLAIAAWNLQSLRPNSVTRFGLLLVAVILAVPLVELLPLPPWIWHLLPGRSQIAAELDLVGLSNVWQPVTLAARECWLAFLSLLPPVTLFLVTMRLDERQRRSLLVIVLIWTCAGVGLSLFQMLGGGASPLRFYAETNLDRAVGFFANANHNALALCLSIPILMLLTLGSRSPGLTPARGLLAAAIVISVLVAVSLTRSRAGIGLIALSLLVSATVLFSRLHRGGRRKRYVIGAVCLLSLALFSAFQAGFVAFSERFEAPLAEDLRWGLLKVSYSAALHYFPVGSGLGSFVPIYERFAPLTLVHEAYVNHAHDDWIELFVELGLLWPILAFAWLAWVGFAVRARTRRGGDWANSEIAFCLLTLLLIALASAMDYPLRTIALLSITGVTCGLLVEPLVSDDGRARSSESAP